MGRELRTEESLVFECESCSRQRFRMYVVKDFAVIDGKVGR